MRDREVSGRVYGGSLVERGVDGNLKVIVVEVGRLVQHGENIREDVRLVVLCVGVLLCPVLSLLLALPLGPHCLRCPGGELLPRPQAIISVGIEAGAGVDIWVVSPRGGGRSGSGGHHPK